MFKRITSIALAVLLLLACIPAVSAAELVGPAVIGFEIMNEDDLPDLIWNDYYSNQDNAPTACGIWNIDTNVKFLVTFADHSTEVIGFMDTVNGESVGAYYELNGVGDNNYILYSLAGIDDVCTVTIIESPVDHIEIVSPPNALVVGQDSAALKIGNDRGVESRGDTCYEGLSFRVYYKNGTDELIRHEDLEFGSYAQDTSLFYTFPKYNGYAVETTAAYGDTGFTYWTGPFTNPEGVIPMHLHYKGYVVSFDVTVVEGPRALVVRHPSDTTANEGGTGYFYVGITGPNMTYQWQYRENENADWTNLEWGTGPEIEVVAELWLNGYQFRCVGTDENEYVVYSDAATLTVLEVDKYENYDTYEISDLVLGPDGIYRTPEDQIVYIGLYVGIDWLGGMPLGDYVDAYGGTFFDMTYWNDLLALMDEEGYVVLTDKTLEYLVTTISGNPQWGETAEDAKYYLFYDKEPSPAEVFTDVPEAQYYYEPVMWAVENGITTGTGDGTTFSPDRACTRAQVVTFLWRAAGCPEPQSMNHNFTDVVAGSYYEKAVIWAVENGITSGKGSATTFQPETTCNRAEVVTFLWRAKGKPTPESNSNPFPDVPAGSYYEQAVLWAVENGITTGKGNGNFAPTENCTRAHVVTFLYRAFA